MLKLHTTPLDTISLNLNISRSVIDLKHSNNDKINHIMIFFSNFYNAI